MPYKRMSEDAMKIQQGLIASKVMFPQKIVSLRLNRISELSFQIQS